jgi:hypothetical protein
MRIWMMNLAEIINFVWPIFSELQSFIYIDKFSIFILIKPETLSQLIDFIVLAGK